MITIDREAKHFWKVPEKATDIIYFANRYFGIVGAIFGLVYITRCKFSSWVTGIVDWMTLSLINYIVTIRVLALYTKHRSLTRHLYTLLGVEGSLRLALTIGITVLEQNANASWWWELIHWTPAVSYGLLLMVLAVRKAVEYRKISNGSKGFVLVDLVVRDQLRYFLLAIWCCILDTLASKMHESTPSLAATFMFLGSPSFLCILGSRMLLNLREALRREVECLENGETSRAASSTTATEIEFA